jgi:hypothetical protein
MEFPAISKAAFGTTPEQDGVGTVVGVAVGDEINLTFIALCANVVPSARRAYT